MSYMELNSAQQTSYLYREAKHGAELAGYTIQRAAMNPSGAQIVELHKDGRVIRAAIRTTRNRWVAFVPLADGAWKTLDDADAVLLATPDRNEGPSEIQVFLIPAEAVRDRLDAAFPARIEAGHTIKIGGFGMWISLDPYADAPYSAGSGLAAAFEPIARIPLAVADAGEQEDDAHTEEDDAPTGVAPPLPTSGQRPGTIADVLREAREKISAIAGVNVDAVALDLKIQW